MITFNFEDIPVLDLPKNAEYWLQELIKSESKKLGEINYILCSDSYLLAINNKYLNHDDYTDIITFDYVKGKTISGDIFVSLQRVTENSLLLSTTFEEELKRVLAHGVLHLCGYKDKTEEEQIEMRAKENFYLNLYLK